MSTENRPSTPLFSVIVPTFGRQAFLEEALASIAAQTVRDFECLVVDDGSPVPVELGLEDDRFRLIRRQENRGPAAARNTGIRAARGTYLAFLDDDDLYLPHRLELALEAHRQAPVAVCGAPVLDGGVPSARRRPGRSVRQRILAGVTPPLDATTVERESMLLFDERYLACQDVEWWVRMSAKAEAVAIARAGCLIRPHQGVRNLNGDLARLRFSQQLLEDHAEFFEAHPTARATRLTRVGLIALRLGRRRTAAKAFFRALLIRPSLRRVWHLSRTLGPIASPGGPAASDRPPPPAQAPEPAPLDPDVAVRWIPRRTGPPEATLTPASPLLRPVFSLSRRLPRPLDSYSRSLALHCSRRSETYLRTPWAAFRISASDQTLLIPAFNEPLEVAVVCRLLEAGSNVLDVGANRGFYTLLFASLVGSSGRVLAVEPDRRARHQLLQNLEVNGRLAQRVRIEDVAASSTEGTAELLSHRQPSLSHIVPEGAGSGDRRVVTVPVDHLVEKHEMEPVAFVKIDVEGAELRVLEGARGVLRRDRPLLLIEAETEHLRRFGAAPVDLVEELGPRYRCYWLQWDVGRAAPFTERQPRHGRNLLAVPEEDLERFTAIIPTTKG